MVATKNNLDQKLTECEARADEYLNGWKKARADFLNYKKEQSERLAEIIKFANEDLILQLLEVADDLDIAAKHQSGSEGMIQIAKKVEDFLNKQGVEKIVVEGEKFDPNLHEAVEGSEEKGQIEEIRAGYTMHGKVVRPARIKITNKN